MDVRYKNRETKAMLHFNMTGTLTVVDFEQVEKLVSALHLIVRQKKALARSHKR